MGKVAKLVVTTFITRVVVDENVSLEEIAELIKPKLLDKINNNEVAENIETMLPDEECPYENDSDNVIYNNDTNELTIIYPNYGSENRNRGELFDYLGDFDIIIANELHPDAIIMSGDLYLFSNSDEEILSRNGSITLGLYSTLDDFIDFEDNDQVSFYNWYNHLN